MRYLALLAVFILAAGGAWWFLSHRASPQAGDSIVVYYTKLDGDSEGSWRVSLGPARDPKSVAFYAATQAVAGPPSGTEAIRFPNGTHVLAVDVDAGTADVNLSPDVKGQGGGSFAEGGEFKGLVYTLTALPDIKAVTIRVDGTRIPTLPGGHFELDEPLTRASW
jgi:spore germination protein GerM